MRSKIVLPLIALALLGFAVFHVVKASQQPPPATPPVEPSRNPFRATIAGAGIVEPCSENIAVGAHLPGIVGEVLVQVGDPVEVGTPLFRLDDRQLRSELLVRNASLGSARASLARLKSMPRPEEVPSAEARVREAKANVDDMRDMFRRSAELVRSRAVGDEETSRRSKAVLVAEAQLARATADLDLLKKGAWEADIAVADATVAQALAAVAQTETELERLEVRSPIVGQVLQKNVRPGESVGTAPGQALLVLGDLKRLHVRADIDENDLGRFRPGMPGRATPRGDPSRTVPLTFVRVEPFVVPKRSLTGSGTERVDIRVLQVICAVERTDVPIFVGQQVDVYLDAADSGSAAR